MSRVGTVIASVSTRTRGHLDSFIQSRVVCHRLQIFGEQSEFPLLGVLGIVHGVVLGIVLGVVLGVVLGIVHGVVLVLAALVSSPAHVWFAHTSGEGDPKTTVFVEISCTLNPAPTTARARCWHERGMARMQPPTCLYTLSGLPETQN